MERNRQNLRSAAKARPRSEWVMALVQPLADFGVRRLARTRIDPLAIVSLHGLLGFAAALLIAGGGRGAWLAAALLLLAKTLLDNMDGGLARATGRVTQMGRYYDTVVDLAVNGALFAALSRHGPGWAALIAFAALTLVLSFDFNLERLYRQQRLPPRARAAELPLGAPGRLFALFRGLYGALLAPQDRVIERLDRALFARLYGAPFEAAPPDARLAWSDLFSTAMLVNLGLSSQMMLLAGVLALGRPFWYVWLVLAQLGWLAFVPILRAVRFRHHLGTR